MTLVNSVKSRYRYFIDMPSCIWLLPGVNIKSHYFYSVFSRQKAGTSPTPPPQSRRIIE